MAARGRRKRLSGATAGGWCKGLDADRVRQLRGRLEQYFAGDGRTCGLQRFALSGAWPAWRKTVAGAPFFKRQVIAGRRHHLTTICGKLVTEAAMRSPLRVCADPARKCSGLDDAGTSHGKVGLCPMHCLPCTTCPACDVVLLNALLCVHGAHA